MLLLTPFEKFRNFRTFSFLSPEIPTFFLSFFFKKGEAMNDSYFDPERVRKLTFLVASSSAKGERGERVFAPPLLSPFCAPDAQGRKSHQGPSSLLPPPPFVARSSPQWAPLCKGRKRGEGGGNKGEGGRASTHTTKRIGRGGRGFERAKEGGGEAQMRGKFAVGPLGIAFVYLKTSQNNSQGRREADDDDGERSLKGI